MAAKKAPATTKEALVKDAPTPAAKDGTPKRKVGTRGSSKFPGTNVITLLVDFNPKRKGSASHGRFENYEDEMTVEEAQKAGVTPGDLLWDTAHGFVEVGEKFNNKAVVKSKPEPKAKAEKPAKAPKKGKVVVEEEDEEEDEE